jgi:alkanesulfonate monooxygenase SsuD/methylene tetrahydromethanopterin reductase-like flavin-dependent oxidoreductase (luciferase family)
MSNNTPTDLDPANRSGPKAPSNKGLGGLVRGALGIDAPTVDMSMDECLDVLENRRRRTVIRLVAARGALDLGEVARIIAARENDCATEQVTGQQRKRVYVGLYQTHAEQLADVGAVEYDDGSSMFSPTPQTDALAGLIDDLDDRTGGSA